MKKIFGLVALSSVVLMALPAYAEQDIIGENSGNIKVDGTLGMDNKQENAEIVEGTDQWINVTLPLKTIFYSTSPKAGATITSPAYTITNNSGRPVDISFSKLEKSGGDDVDIDYNVYLRPVNGTFSEPNPQIIKDGDGVDNSGSPQHFHRLPNVNGKLSEGGPEEEDKGGNKINFEYHGAVTNELTETIKHEYTMTLQFKAVSWPEETP